MRPFDIASERILSPGLNVLPPGMERHVVRAGGINVIPLMAGDTLDIVNPQGLQVGEITAFNTSGNNVPGLLDSRADVAWAARHQYCRKYVAKPG